MFGNIIGNLKYSELTEHRKVLFQSGNLKKCSIFSIWKEMS